MNRSSTWTICGYLLSDLADRAIVVEAYLFRQSGEFYLAAFGDFSLADDSASIGAVYLGFLGYLFVMNSRRGGFFLSYLIVVVLAILFLFYLLNLENQSKEKTNASVQLATSNPEDPIPAISIRFGSFHFLICSPGSLFVFSLVLINLFGNPLLRGAVNLPEANYESVIRVILAIILIGIWIMSKAGSSREFKFGDLLWLGLVFLGAILVKQLPTNLTSWIDWPFFTVLLVFLAANLILFQNRYNVTQDMLAMEYYSIQRVLADNDPPLFSKPTHRADFNQD